MRGDDQQQAGMYSYLSPEQRVPQDHPLRAIRKLSDAVFAELSPQFDKLYARMGDLRSRRRSCCERCCCKCSIACAVNGC